jgi:hypothetical protein
MLIGRRVELARCLCDVYAQASPLELAANHVACAGDTNPGTNPNPNPNPDPNPGTNPDPNPDPNPGANM